MPKKQTKEKVRPMDAVVRRELVEALEDARLFRQNSAERRWYHNLQVDRGIYTAKQESTASNDNIPKMTRIGDKIADTLAKPLREKKDDWYSFQCGALDGRGDEKARVITWRTRMWLDRNRIARTFRGVVRNSLGTGILAYKLVPSVRPQWLIGWDKSKTQSVERGFLGIYPLDPWDLMLSPTITNYEPDYIAHEYRLGLGEAKRLWTADDYYDEELVAKLQPSAPSSIRQLVQSATQDTNYVENGRLTAAEIWGTVWGKSGDLIMENETCTIVDGQVVRMPIDNPYGAMSPFVICTPKADGRAVYPDTIYDALAPLQEGLKDALCLIIDCARTSAFPRWEVNTSALDPITQEELMAQKDMPDGMIMYTRGNFPQGAVKPHIIPTNSDAMLRVYQIIDAEMQMAGVTDEVFGAAPDKGRTPYAQFAQQLQMASGQLMDYGTAIDTEFLSELLRKIAWFDINECVKYWDDGTLAAMISSYPDDADEIMRWHKMTPAQRKKELLGDYKADAFGIITALRKSESMQRWSQFAEIALTPMPNGQLNPIGENLNWKLYEKEWVKNLNLPEAVVLEKPANVPPTPPPPPPQPQGAPLPQGVAPGMPPEMQMSPQQLAQEIAQGPSPQGGGMPPEMQMPPAQLAQEIAQGPPPEMANMGGGQ